MRRLVPWILIVVLAVGYRYARTHVDNGGHDAPVSTVAHVVRAVDGDTLVVTFDRGGSEERVRYIGVDTPETVKPNTPVQCFGKKASAFNHTLVDGHDVRLRYDAERRDRYGRLLAYVYRADDGLFVNAALVRGGYATTLTIPPNVRFAARFRDLAEGARRAGRGLWSACER
ncbi:Thermonuclease [Baekduia alba]|uniref:thermonuclease family protein n=1 Tax=Baekduia alba TaxID=2997333 RepID=UPI002342404C|nr:thermonuclease family protein [Baekduia alba]WCB92414.1 Thermonuclease [Baekduia alba]